MIKANDWEGFAMFFAVLSAIAAGITVLDQVTKFLTISNIPLYGESEFLPGILKFTYVRNTGAAFSSFQGMQWLFALVFLVFTGLVVWEYFKKPLPFSRFERIMIACVYGGGLGNMLDRLRLGYVVDMIETEFITFPVFNVADCFITCGSIALMVSLVFFNKAFWKEDSK